MFSLRMGPAEWSARCMQTLILQPDCIVSINSYNYDSSSNSFRILRRQNTKKSLIILRWWSLWRSPLVQIFKWATTSVTKLQVATSDHCRCGWKSCSAVGIFEVFLGTCDIGMMRQCLGGKVMFFCNLIPGFHHFDLLLVLLSLAESYCDIIYWVWFRDCRPNTVRNGNKWYGHDNDIYGYIKYIWYYRI